MNEWPSIYAWIFCCSGPKCIITGIGRGDSGDAVLGAGEEEEDGGNAGDDGEENGKFEDAGNLQLQFLRD